MNHFNPPSFGRAARWSTVTRYWSWSRMSFPSRDAFCGSRTSFSLCASTRNDLIVRNRKSSRVNDPIALAEDPVDWLVSAYDVLTLDTTTVGRWMLERSNWKSMSTTRTFPPDVMVVASLSLSSSLNVSNPASLHHSSMRDTHQLGVWAGTRGMLSP